MIWALIEVVLPMLLTFLFGLLIGRLWWQRHKTHFEQQSIDHAGVSGSSVLSAHSDAEDIKDDDLQSGRFMQEQALAKELTSANASIRSLVAELDVTRTRLQSCESQLAASGIAEVAVISAGGTDSAEHVSDNLSDSGSTAVEQLRLLQQNYQELETSRSIDKAELAKKDHLEARLNNVNKELTESKSELADAKKTVGQLQAEVEVLKQAGSDDAQRNSGDRVSNRTNKRDSEIAQLKAHIAEITPAAEQARDYQSQVAALQAQLQQAESRTRKVEQSGERIDKLDSQLHSRLADELEKAQQRILELEQKASESVDKSADLVRIRSRVATLESELGEANSRAEDADKLQRRVTDLQNMLKGSEVKVTKERLIEAEAQLRIANNRVAEQQQTITRLQIDSGDSNDAIASFDSKDGAHLESQATLSVRRQRGAGLAGADVERSKEQANGRSANGPCLDAKPTEDSASTGETRLPAWHAGVTRFGTPAARHKDDLKVIRGIGPVLEKTLNEAEIQTWDQLAALQKDEVQLIEQSMDFPGRMTREKWVEQAAELISLYPGIDGRPSGKKLLPKKQ